MKQYVRSMTAAVQSRDARAGTSSTREALHAPRNTGDDTGGGGDDGTFDGGGVCGGGGDDGVVLGRMNIPVHSSFRLIPYRIILIPETKFQFHSQT